MCISLVYFLFEGKRNSRDPILNSQNLQVATNQKGAIACPTPNRHCEQSQVQDEEFHFHRPHQNNPYPKSEWDVPPHKSTKKNHIKMTQRTSTGCAAVQQINHCNSDDTRRIIHSIHSASSLNQNGSNWTSRRKRYLVNSVEFLIWMSSNCKILPTWVRWMRLVTNRTPGNTPDGATNVQ